MAVTPNLTQLLTLNSLINTHTLQQIEISNKLDANSAKLSKQVKYEEKWNEAYDKALEEGRNSELKYNYNGLSGVIGKEQVAASQAVAEAYAYTKVGEYNEELLLELSDLDIDYDTTKNMLDTLLEEERTQRDAIKQVVSTEAQDTHLLSQ